MRSKAELVIEIREILSAIERDLDPYFWGDSMRYSGYLQENTVELYAFIQKLLEVK
jgi:hypothetical protein